MAQQLLDHPTGNGLPLCEGRELREKREGY